MKWLILIAVVAAVAHAEEVEMLNEATALMPPMPEASDFACNGGYVDSEKETRTTYEWELMSAVKKGHITEAAGKHQMKLFSKNCDEFNKDGDSRLKGDEADQQAVQEEFTKQEATELGEDASAKAMAMPTISGVTCTHVGADEYQDRLTKAKIPKAEGLKKLDAFNAACAKYRAKAERAYTSKLGENMDKVEHDLGDSVDIEDQVIPAVTPENCSKERIQQLKTVLLYGLTKKSAVVQESTKAKFGNFVATCEGFSDSPEPSKERELGDDDSTSDTDTSTDTEMTEATKEDLEAQALAKDVPSANKENCADAMIGHYQLVLQKLVTDKQILQKEGHLRMSILSQLCNMNVKVHRTERLEKLGGNVLKQDSKELGDSAEAGATAQPQVDDMHCTEAVTLAYQKRMEDAKTDPKVGKKALGAFVDACATFLKESQSKLGDSVEEDHKPNLNFTPKDCSVKTKALYEAALRGKAHMKQMTREAAKNEFGNWLAECEGFSNLPVVGGN